MEEDTISKRAKWLNYPTELIQPIIREQPFVLGMFGADYAEQQEYKRREAIALRKLDMLFTHYRLPRESSLALAFTLALDWVPGFHTVDKPPAKAGRPKRNHDDLLVALYNEIEAIRAESKLTRKSWACRKWATTKNASSDVKYKGLLSTFFDTDQYKNCKPSTLENYYDKGRVIAIRRRKQARNSKRVHRMLLGAALAGLGEEALRRGLLGQLPQKEDLDSTEIQS